MTFSNIENARHNHFQSDDSRRIFDGVLADLGKGGHKKNKRHLRVSRSLLPFLARIGNNAKVSCINERGLK